MKPGTRLKSAACDTEVMVIRCGDGAIECGGAPMADAKPADAAALNADHSGGTLMGKRYVDADGAYELLCVKPGKGSLSVDGVALVTKDAKPLPASD
ncbi:MAG: hypothetical protein P8J20_10250 [Novosphingobium sp.]|nr:hypothetical protein [Novosphingobium sp.]